MNHQADRFHGEGVYVFPDHSTYIGAFESGLFSGFGRLKVVRENFYGKLMTVMNYDGEFKAGKKVHLHP